MSSVSIIIPAYNEENAIGHLLDELNSKFPNYEIIVVNDGSSDRTQEIVNQKSCKIINHPVNLGYGASWKTGVRAAKGDIVIFFDGDGQFNISDLSRLIDLLEEKDADLVSGARGVDSFVPLARKPGKFILTMLANYIARRQIPDINCGLRAYRRDVLLNCLPLLPNGFSASLTSLLLFYRRNYQVLFLPITAHKPQSKSSVRIVHDGLTIVMLMVRLVALFEPLRIFLPLSLVLMLSSFVYGLSEALTKGNGVPVLAAIVFMSGFLLFFMGIVCDQISALRLERLSDTEITRKI